jgi:hypothetical protein
MSRIPNGAVAMLAAAIVTCLPASPAHGQVALQAGVTINGSITDGDLTLTDKSKFDEYTYRGRRGDQVTITMRSSEFDTYLYIGRMVNGQWQSVASDDDSGGDTDSLIELVRPADGEYVIRANALSDGDGGAYTLQLNVVGAGRLGAGAVRLGAGADRAPPRRAAATPTVVPGM